jgi:hypothetical protein
MTPITDSGGSLIPFGSAAYQPSQDRKPKDDDGEHASLLCSRRRMKKTREDDLRPLSFFPTSPHPAHGCWPSGAVHLATSPITDAECCVAETWRKRNDEPETFTCRARALE